MNDAGTCRTAAVMGTLVTIQVVRPGAGAAIDHAFGWFHEIEACCTRFDPDSELMQLTAQWGAPVPTSPILFEAVQFALSVAEQTEGAFDPTVGRRLEAAGFNREHRSGATVETALVTDTGASFRDVVLDADRRTITLLRPLILDLGAVVKGLAVDLAARELAPFRDFAIDAGGDLYLSGTNTQGAAWSVGIRHPRQDHEVIATLSVSDQAVCTSGDYERGTHILDGRTGLPAPAVASATVVASGAMLADALATAAFVLGPAEGIEFLDRMGVDGLMITPELQRYATQGLRYAA